MFRLPPGRTLSQSWSSVCASAMEATGMEMSSRSSISMIMSMTCAESRPSSLAMRVPPSTPPISCTASLSASRTTCSTLSAPTAMTAFQAATGRLPPSLTRKRRCVASRSVPPSWRSRNSLRVTLRTACPRKCAAACAAAPARSGSECRIQPRWPRAGGRPVRPAPWDRSSRHCTTITATSVPSPPDTENAEASVGRTSGCCSARFSRSCGQMLRPLMISRSLARPVRYICPSTR